MPTPLLDRIEARKLGLRYVQPPKRITDHMSEFSRRLLERNLPTADKSVYRLGSFVPDGDGGAA